MISAIKNLTSDNKGSVSVSASLLIGTFIILVGGGLELTFSYWQSNTMQHAAKHGARIAITSAPVATELTTMTGMEGGANPGDPMSDYKIVCSGKTSSCNRGGFDQSAFNKIFYGRDEDGTCGATSDERRGLCDIFDNVTVENMTVTYENSGLGRAGSPPDLMPLVTVEIQGIEKDYLFLDLISSALGSKTMSARAASIGEDMN